MKRYTVLVCCKYVLFIAALLPMAVVIFVMFPFLTWAWRLGILMPFLLLLLWGMLEAVKAMLKKRSERLQPSSSCAAPTETGDRIMELQQSWRTAIGTLRGSQLKREGDPLRVLPWYLMLGEAGSGKTGAVRGARLFSPFAEQKGGEAATENCEWHFYDEGIVVDTAGRYAVPLDPAADHEEWLAFLSLLKRYRKKEPVNGVILAVAADRLSGGASQELEDLGRQLRCRIDEMIRYLGATFPVYLLVTKCDLIAGMGAFCDGLPLEGLDQPMGLTSSAKEQDLPRFVERFCAVLDQRLGILRLIMAHRGSLDEAQGNRLLFPDRLRCLRPALDLFVRAAFARNHYQETPLLRGIYLCSAGEGSGDGNDAQPEGASASETEPSSRPAVRALFLHDFFEKVLPADRGLWSPSAKTLRRRHFSDNLTLVCWWMLGVSLCILLSCSFVKNLAVMREAASLAASLPQRNGEASGERASMERLRTAIVALEHKNRQWWVPRFGLTRSLDAEEALKRVYCREYRDRLLSACDADLAALLGTLSAATPDELFAGCVVHLARRCNLLKGRSAGGDLDALSAYPLPQYWIPGRAWDPDPVSANLYLCYVAWSKDEAGAGRELQRMQDMLKRALRVREGDFTWIAGYVDREEASSSVTLRQFWNGSHPLSGELSVAPSFTRKGRERIASVLAEVCAAHPEPETLDRPRKDFLGRRGAAEFHTWQNFAGQLPQGERMLIAPKEWRNAAAVMAGDQSPYFGFMSRAVDELEPLRRTDSLPPWIVAIYRFQTLRTAGPAGVASSLMDRGERRAGGRGVADDKTALFPGNEPGVNLAKEYLNALAQIAPAAKSRTLAYRMAQQAFSGTAEAGASPLFQAADAAQKLNQFLLQGRPDDTFSRLLFGPITFYGKYVRMETACALQAQWEQTVLKEVQGQSDTRTMQYLLGKDGPVWRYVGDYANPFISWSPARGYYPKTALGGAIPFRPEFYAFLAKGGKVKFAAAPLPPKEAHYVTIKGLPTDANSEAHVKPQGTKLELHCVTGTQVIANMNYPVTKAFVWTPDACGDVVFKVEVGETVLTRRYAGSEGFASFLRDFPGGRHTFRPRDFPDERPALERMGIRFIKVNYELYGAGGIAAPKDDALPARVPAKIAECWD